MAPEYTRPEAPVPTRWPRGAAYKDTHGVAEEQAVPELKWEDFFADGQLLEIIQTALNNNLDLRLAALNVERARALYGIQRAELFPAIDALGSEFKQRVPADLSTTGQSATRSQYDVNLGVTSWEIDFFGRIRSLEERALQEYLATEQGRRSVRIALIAEVARTYLTLATDRSRLQLARSTLQSQQANYQLIKRRFELGLGTDLDLRQAQTRVDTARRDIPRFTQFVAQDQNALNLLAGAPIPENLLPVDLKKVIPPEDISPGLSSEVLLNRPDIMAAEHRLKGAYAFIGAARAAFFPRISLTAAFGTASADLSGLFKAGSAAWTFAPQVVLPIFDARIWAALRVSKADREIAVTQYQKTIQTAFREVADSLAVQGTIDQQVAAQQSLVNATEETYRLSNIRFEKGLDNYLAVLVAQQSLYAQQQVLIELHLARLANRVSLYAVLGGGGGPAEANGRNGS